MIAKRLSRCIGLATVVVLSIGLGHAKAQNYPSQAVTIVVPFLAGGAVDAMGRIVAAKLQEYWKQPVLIENRPGAGGNLGSNSVALASPDGYRLLLAPHGPVSYNIALYKIMPYDPAKAFSPITVFAKSPNFLIVARNAKWETLADLIGAAKADPGKVTYASQGVGTTPHLTGARLGLEAKVEMVHVPYRGFPPAVADLISGRVTFMFADSGNTLPQVANKLVKVLAIASDTRWPDYPDVKTMTELGYPGFVSNVWYSLLAPARTPMPIIEKVRADFLRAAEDPESIKKLQQLGLQIVGTTPTEASKILAEETLRWGKVIRSTGLNVD